MTGTLPKRRRRAKYYQFTAIDDCTRLRVLRIYRRCDQKTAVQFLDYVLERLPFRIEIIQTDNGAEFQSAFHRHVLDKGIAHTYIKPASPHLNGKVERSHRIDADEFYRMLDGIVIDDTGVFNDKLREWEDYYNYHRPHGALGGQTPATTRPTSASVPSRRVVTAVVGVCVVDLCLFFEISTVANDQARLGSNGRECNGRGHKWATMARFLTSRWRI